MNIKLNKKYSIVSDSNQFIVQKIQKVTKKDSKSYGQETKENIAYFAHIDGAIDYVANRVLIENDDMDVIRKELRKIKEIAREIVNNIWEG